jgi:hypothetical protein
MQQATRNNIEFIREISRYSLLGLLIINILSPFAILVINPEAFFLGQKIAGTPAVVYALGFFLVTGLVMFCLYKKIKGNEFVALVYGVFYFIDGYLTVLYYDSQVPTPIHWFILVLSVILSAVTLLNQPGKSSGKSEIPPRTVFMEKPFAGVLVIFGVLFCFLLSSSIALLTYEKEYNSYVYQIEINPASPLHNVTLMVPLPSRISQNITDGDLPGSSLPYFTNYSQSVVETENGTMIKITADSVEKPGDGLPREPAGLYLDFFTSNPINYSYPLEHEPVLLPKFSPEISVCNDKKFQRLLTGNTPSACLDYESPVYAAFETAPASRTIITVSSEGMRMISSSGSPKNHGYQDSISVTFIGNAYGWYNASGSLLAG